MFMSKNASHQSCDQSGSSRFFWGFSARLRRWCLLIGLSLIVGVVGWWGWRNGCATFFRQGCLRAQADGDWEATEQQALLWASYAPGSAAPFVYAAEAALARQAMPRAAAYLDLVPNDDPAAVPALLERVDMLFADLADPFAAEQTCRRILAIDPTTGDAHQRLTFFYAVTLQRTLLANQARQAIQHGCELPEAYVYLVAADWITLSNIVRVNQPWQARWPDEELFLVAIARGEVSARGQDLSPENDEAAATGEHATAQEPIATMRTLRKRFPGNLELLAFALERAITAGDQEAVATLLAAVPKSGTQDNRFWRFKGWLHGVRQEFDEAHQAFHHALSLNPFDFLTRHYLADVARKRGETETASQLAVLARSGRQLRRTIMEQPEVRSMSLPVMQEIAEYIDACGEPTIAERLYSRIEQMKLLQPAPEIVDPL